MNNNKTILASAYAVNPFKGSEDGMGWNFICQIARFNKVIAVTRENNRPHIEKYMAANPNEIYQNIEFRYFDLPYWMRFWKKGQRGAMLYYWMWQKGIISFIRNQKIEFDIVHNLNFHNDWTPSYLWKLDKPFVWGPVGHHPQIPNEVLAHYPLKYKIKEKLTWLVKNYFWKISPALKSTTRNANTVLCMNKSAQEVLHLQQKHQVIPSVASEDFGINANNGSTEKFTLLSIGRLVPLKGFDLTIEAYAQFLESLSPEKKNQTELIIVGSGPELCSYKELVSKYKIQEYVQFREWMDRKELIDIYRNSSAFLFPSHEGAGMVVSEALSFSLPVICLNNSGPGEFIDSTCGIAVQMEGYQETIKSLSKAITRLFQNPEVQKQMSLSARKKFEQYFHWDKRGEQLNLIYQNI